MDRRSGGQLHRAPGSLIARDGCFGFAPFVSGVMSIYLQVLLLSNLAGFLFHYGTLVCVSDLAIAKQLFDSFSDAHERIYARTHGALTRHVRGESPAEQKLPVSCVTERRLSLMPTQLYAARSPIASPITLLSISVLLPAGCCFFHPLRIAASLEACLCLSLLGDVGPPQPDAGFCPDNTGRGGIHGGE